MKTLYLLRHAKSSWKDSKLSDFERPLNKRGRTTAPLMGGYIAERGMTPAVIVSSPAVRATETAEAIAERCGYDEGIVFARDLYPTASGACINVLRTMDDAASVMLVGHNPGLEEFLTQLTGCVEPLQTGTLAKIELNLDRWAEFSRETRGNLIQIFRPRELFDL